MRLAEFKRAFQIAKDKEIDINLSEIDVFSGFGLPDFKPVSVTINQIAGLIRWQAHCLDGSWNNEALEEIRNLGRKRFLILD